MKAFFEHRVNDARGTSSQAADLTRHLHTRQYLGRTVVICEQPIAMLSAIRKQWLRLSRSIQYQRSATLNVDKLLKYTHTITRMQRMQFTTKSPSDLLDADVYCLRPDDVQYLPDECYTLYITVKIKRKQAEHIAHQLPEGALVIDYTKTDFWSHMGLLPKSAIEQAVTDSWKEVENFLERYKISPDMLFNVDTPDVEAMDDALDTLLGVSKSFMALADNFHQTLALARPMQIGKTKRMKYDSLALLAHRVQALSPGEYTQRFLETYNEDDGQYFRDSTPPEILIAQFIEIRDQELQHGHLNIAHAYSEKIRMIQRQQRQIANFRPITPFQYYGLD